MKRRYTPQYQYPPMKKSKFVPPRFQQAPTAPRQAQKVTGEMKYFDTEHTETALVSSATWANTSLPPNVGTPTTLVVPTSGAAINQRIGRKIKLMKLTVRWTVTCGQQTNQTAGDYPCNIRLLLVQDMQTNGTQATGTDIMSGGSVAENAVQCFQSLASLGRYKVWKDKMISLQNPNATYDGTNIEQQGLTRTGKFSLKFKKPIEVSFNATGGGTIADVVDNSFCLYANAGDVTLVPYLKFYSRAYYKE